MKLMQKLGSIFGSIFGRPAGKRGFSWVDLLVLPLIGLAVIANVLIHEAPSTTTIQSRPTASQPVSQAKAQEVALAIPSMPSSQQLSQTPQQPGQTTRQALIPGDTTATPGTCSSAWFGASTKIKGPLGANDQFFFCTIPDLTVNQPAVKTLEEIVRATVNVMVVVVLILAGMRVMLGGSIFRHANAIETLPGVLLALVAANLALGIVTLALGLNNALSQDFYTYSQNNASITKSGLVTGARKPNADLNNKVCNNLKDRDPNQPIVGDTSDELETANEAACSLNNNKDFNNKDATNWDQVLQDSISPPKLSGGFSLSSLEQLWKIISNPLQFIAGVLSLVLIGQMVIRIFLLDFFIILAPFGLGCWALPGRAGQSLTRLWLQGFFSTLFAQFVQVVALVVIHLLIGAIAQQLYPAFHDLANSDDNTLLWVLVIAEYWLVIRIPSMLGSNSTNMMVSFGGAISQAASTVMALTMAEAQFVSSLVIGGASTGIAAAAR
jgi:hypothetical protein